MKSSQNNIQIDRNFLQVNFAGSLMQSLQGIPGVKAMNIGSGQSKPTIRGMGFNRMVVTEDGIKHEGQQWGDDHGLEIDQFSIDRIEIIKGPSALFYGSDAIGGVVNLYNNYLPVKPFGGSLILFARSNNESLGFSAKMEGRHNKFYYKANITMIDYADFRVPTDSIQYYSYFIQLKDQRLRNTAGKEHDGSVALGYVIPNFKTELRLSNSYVRCGFFANAHGLEVRLSDIDYDRSRRDIDLPYQSVNHLKVMSHTVWQHGNMHLHGDLAYQNNLRKEQSEAVSHGYMPIPPHSLEREFQKHTFTGNLGLSFSLSEANMLTIGFNSEYQHNRRDGWGFIIPDFETFSAGTYVFDKHKLSDNFCLNAGLRYDFAHTHIRSYHDWYTTPTENGYEYKERSGNTNRHFNSFTWSAGMNYSHKHWILKANIGKSFRIPIPKELGVDGINYHIFRYEKGNAGLSPEESYQVDAGIHWNNGRMSVQLDPYFNYFSNYIYLNPTPNYVEGLQKYDYTQSKVMRYGFEFLANYRLFHNLEASMKGEYLYAEQLSGEKRGYTLPFSSPMSMNVGLKYEFGEKGYMSVDGELVAAQHNIVPPEKPTDGYFTLNMTAGKTFVWDKHSLRVGLNAENILNKKYYNHTSYYRLIDVPEPGINLSLMIVFNF
ncbi:MAG: TonB-dependent receptor [Prevotellaceae bacterium]|nr:TonB-dependent receptor [Prevotella sp.]MDD7257553.1 TonB-dependent receptor [Prevotellaceae bacterium]MDY6130661.1 TonB-dependent receptor [Prevotella sp.]